MRIALSLFLLLAVSGDLKAAQFDAVVLVHGRGLLRQPSVGPAYAATRRELKRRYPNAILVDFAWNDANGGVRRARPGGLSYHGWSALPKLKHVIASLQSMDAKVTIVSSSEGALLTTAALHDGVSVENWVIIGGSIGKAAAVRDKTTLLETAVANVRGKVINCWAGSGGGSLGTGGIPTGRDSERLLPLIQSGKLKDIKIADVARSSADWWDGAWVEKLPGSFLSQEKPASSKQLADLLTESSAPLGGWATYNKPRFDKTVALQNGVRLGLNFVNHRTARVRAQCRGGKAKLQIFARSVKGAAKTAEVAAGGNTELFFNSSENNVLGGPTTIEVRLTGLADRTSIDLEITSESEAFPELSYWKNVLSFRPPTPTSRKVSQQGRLWEVLRLENATSESDVNLDVYSVHIDRFPTLSRASTVAKKEPVIPNGVKLDQPLTQTQFLEFVRLNLSGFVDERISVFRPMQKDIWKSTNYDSSIVHIDMSIPLFGSQKIGAEQASVVATKRTKNEWIFSTIRSGGPIESAFSSEKAAAHPLSGNRAFGIYGAGSGYVFYTIAANRRTRWIDEEFSSAVIHFQDKLWRSMQARVVDFIKDNGGKATIGRSDFRSVPWATIKKSAHYSPPLPVSEAQGQKTIEESELQVGDIILSTTTSKVSEAIRGLTQGDVSHASLYLGSQDGQPTIVEAVTEKVRSAVLKDSLSNAKLALVLRHPAMTKEKGQQLAQFASKQQGKQYNWVGIIKQGFCEVGGVFCEVLPSERWFCSQLVLSAFDHVDLSLKLENPRHQSPADLLPLHLTGSLQYVGHLKTGANGRTRSTVLPGVYVGARDVAGLPWGRHQFLILVPRSPDRFRKYSLSSPFPSQEVVPGGMRAIVIGAHNVPVERDTNRLRVRHFETNDWRAFMEYLDPTKYVNRFAPDFDLLLEPVNLEGKDVDESIKQILDGAVAFRMHQDVEYPATSETLFDSNVLNSNSWVQTLVEVVVGKGKVKECFGQDTGCKNRFPPSDFTAPTKKLQIPFPSSDVNGCREFYENEEIARALTPEFMANAISACQVTGTTAAAKRIREELQRTYRITKPANGRYFTASEHKSIHDEAYRAADCKEDSATILGWLVVNNVKLPPSAIDWSIQTFGACTVEKDENR